MNLENRFIIFDNKEFKVLSSEFSPSRLTVSLLVKDIITNRTHLISLPASEICLN